LIADIPWDAPIDGANITPARPLYASMVLLKVEGPTYE